MRLNDTTIHVFNVQINLAFIHCRQAYLGGAAERVRGVLRQCKSAVRGVVVNTRTVLHGQHSVGPIYCLLPALGQIGDDDPIELYIMVGRILRGKGEGDGLSA